MGLSNVSVKSIEQFTFSCRCPLVSLALGWDSLATCPRALPFMRKSPLTLSQMTNFEIGTESLSRRQVQL